MNELINENVEHNVPHFFISRNGVVTTFDINHSTETIICLEDVGPLILSENKYIDFLGTIYKDTDEIVKIAWRGKEYWVEYTEKQYNTLRELLSKMSGEIILEKDRSSISRKPNPTFKIK